MSGPTTQAYSGPVRGHAHLWFCSNPLPCELGAPHDCSEASAAALAETPEAISAALAAFYCERHQQWEPVGDRYCQNPSVV